MPAAWQGVRITPGSEPIPNLRAPAAVTCSGALAPITCTMRIADRPLLVRTT